MRRAGPRWSRRSPTSPACRSTRPDAGAGAGDLHVLDGRHPAARRLLRQALRLPGRGRGGLLRRWPSSACSPASCRRFYYLRIVKVMYFDEPDGVLRQADRDRSRADPDRRRHRHRCSSSVLPGPLLRRRRRRPRRRWSRPDQRRLAFRLAPGAPRQPAQHDGPCRLLAEAAEPGDLVVWAGEQTAGRGRQGRTWVSPPGNLYATLLLRPPGRPADARAAGLCRRARPGRCRSAWIAARAA